MKKEKFSFLQLVLTILYVFCLVITNITVVKTVQLPFSLVMTGSLFIFPITYILSDVFSEVYGYKWSRITCYLAFIFNFIASLIFTAVIKMPNAGDIEISNAFEMVLGNTPRILFASFTAFMCGDFINDKVFAKMKKKHKNEHKGFEIRAILSSLFGEMADSLVFFPICYLGNIPFSLMINMMLTETFMKTGYEVLILPVTRVVMKKVSKYEKSK